MWRTVVRTFSSVFFLLDYIYVVHVLQYQLACYDIYILIAVHTHVRKPQTF